MGALQECLVASRTGRLDLQGLEVVWGHSSLSRLNKAFSSVELLGDFDVWMATLSFPGEGIHFPNPWPPKAEHLVGLKLLRRLTGALGPLRVLLPKADTEEVCELRYTNQCLVPKIPTSSLQASTLPPVKWGTERNSRLHLPSSFFERLRI